MGLQNLQPFTVTRHTSSSLMIRLLSIQTLPSYPRWHPVSPSLNPFILLFYPSPQNDLEWSLHSLDVKGALAFYLNKTKDFRQTAKLLFSYQGLRKEHLVSSQWYSKYITQAIALTYELANKPLPRSFHSHSTSAICSSMGFIQGVRSAEQQLGSIQWSLSHTID